MVGEKLSHFQANKIKNEHSTILFGEPTMDIRLRMESHEKHKDLTEAKLAELSRGIEDASHQTLHDSLKRRQVAKIIIGERKERLKRLVRDIDFF